MPVCKRLNIIAIVFILITACNVYGYEDGFGQSKKITTKQFEVYYSPQLDVSALAKKLKISFSDRVLVGTYPKQSASIGELELAEANLDGHFPDACDTQELVVRLVFNPAPRRRRSST